MNSDRKELIELINKISHEITELRYVKPKLKGGLRLMLTNDMLLQDAIKLKMFNIKPYVNKYILVDSFANELVAVYNTTDEYAIFKIMNLRFGKETKADLIKLLFLYRNNLHHADHFNSLHFALQQLDIKLNELLICYERLNDNVLYEEKGKVENLLKLCKDIIHLRASPKTQKLLDAFHKIENKYKPKGLEQGVKYPFKL